MLFTRQGHSDGKTTCPLLSSESREQFIRFADHLNGFHRLGFNTVHDSEVNFSDTITCKVSEFSTTGTLDIKVYFKDTGTHALLHGSSFHPQHTFREIVKSQLLWFSRICTQQQDFWKTTCVLFPRIESLWINKLSTRHPWGVNDK